jgi:hypothetical protein
MTPAISNASENLRIATGRVTNSTVNLKSLIDSYTAP